MARACASGRTRLLTPSIALCVFGVLGIPPLEATGQNFPDALAGGVMSGRVGSVMRFPLTASLHPDVEAVLTDNTADVDAVLLLGDVTAVNPSVQDAIALILQ